MKYSLKRSLLEKMGIEVIAQGSEYENADTFDIFIPETLEAVNSFFENHFGKAAPVKTYLGFMNAGGRSFWCFSPDKNEKSFGIKFGTYAAPETNVAIRNRYLSQWGIEKSIKNSNVTENDLLSMRENRGLWLEYNGQIDHKPWKFSFLIRMWKSELLPLHKNDSIIPSYALLSPTLWNNLDLVTGLSLPKLTRQKDIKNWIIEQSAPWMARLLEYGLFKYGLHLELHQQNINFLVRDERIVAAVCQDLQDVCEDPIFRFIQNYKGAKTITDTFTPRSHSPVLGEFMLETPRLKSYGSVTGWHRQYIRALGQFDRCLNVSFFGREFEDYDFESATLFQLRKIAKESYNITIADPCDLFHGISMLHEKHQKHIVRNFFNNNNLNFKKCTLEEVLQLFERNYTYGTYKSPWRKELVLKNLSQLNIKISQFGDDGYVVFFFSNDEKQLHLYLNAPGPPQGQLDY